MTVFRAVHDVIAAQRREHNQPQEKKGCVEELSDIHKPAHCFHIHRGSIVYFIISICCFVLFCCGNVVKEFLHGY